MPQAAYIQGLVYLKRKFKEVHCSIIQRHKFCEIVIVKGLGNAQDTIVGVERVWFSFAIFCKAKATPTNNENIAQIKLLNLTHAEIKLLMLFSIHDTSWKNRRAKRLTLVCQGAIHFKGIMLRPLRFTSRRRFQIFPFAKLYHGVL